MTRAHSSALQLQRPHDHVQVLLQLLQLGQHVRIDFADHGRVDGAHLRWPDRQHAVFDGDVYVGGRFQNAEREFSEI